MSDEPPNTHTHTNAGARVDMTVRRATEEDSGVARWRTWYYLCSNQRSITLSSPPYTSLPSFCHPPFSPTVLGNGSEKISSAITLPLCLLFSPSVNHCLSFEHTLAVKGSLLSLSLAVFSFSPSLPTSHSLSYSLLSLKSPLTLPSCSLGLCVGWQLTLFYQSTQISIGPLSSKSKSLSKTK